MSAVLDSSLMRVRHPSVARGIAMLIWCRNRVAFSAILGYCAVLAVLAHTVFADIFQTYLPLPVFMLASVCASPLIGCCVMMLMFFTLETNLQESLDSMKYILRIPARTRDIAVWPMVLGGGFISVWWLGVARLILAPMGAHIPELATVLVLVASLFAIQTVIWTPFSPAIRIFAIVAAFGAITGLAGAAFIGQRGSELPILLMYAVLSIVLAFVAVKGLAARRRGDVISISAFGSFVDWFRNNLLPRGKSSATRRFRSTADAQYWVDWKTEGAPLPIALLVVFAVLTAGASISRGAAALNPAPFDPSVQINAGTLMMLVFTPMSAIMLTAIVGYCAFPPAYLLRLPVLSGDIIAVKLRVALRTALWMCAILALIGCIALFAPAASGSSNDRLGVLLFRSLHANPGAVAFGVLVSFITLFRARTDGMWCAVTRAMWLTAAQVILFNVALFTAGTLNAAYPALMRHLLEHIPALVTVLACIKMVALVCVVSVLRGRNLAGKAALLKAATWWIACVSILAALAVAGRFLFHGDPLLDLAAAALIVPGVRIGLSPIALEWARHR